MNLLSTLALLTLTAATAFAAEWVDISEPITSKVKPGYAGPTAGVVVDRSNGHVFMVVSDQGLWRSTDQGKTFTRCDDKAIGGRGETGWALQADPAGKRLACFMVYGACAMTTDGGTTWSKFSTNHFDVGSVDWADTGKRLLALRHEKNGILTTSDDGGTTWKDLEKGFAGCGVFDRSTFVATKEKEPGIFRSTDAGATWTKVAEVKPTAGTPAIFEGVAYWPTGKSLMVSRDQGATWTELPADATHGPLFHDANHFVVIGKSGFSETKDAGKTWQPAAPLPPGFTAKFTGPNFAWDHTANIFYASTMMKPTLKFERGK